MLLYPLYLIRLIGPDNQETTLFADHPSQKLGSVYKLAKDHSESRVMRAVLKAQGEKEKYISAHCDLRVFAEFVPHDPSTPDKQKVIKQAVFNVASLMVYDLRDRGTFMGGFELDPVTLKPSYWLVIPGFTAQSRIALKRFREKLK